MKAFQAEVTAALLLGCLAAGVCQEVSPASEALKIEKRTVERNVFPDKGQNELATKEQAVDIRKLIEQLAFIPAANPQAAAKAVPKRITEGPFAGQYEPLAEEEDPPEIVAENRKRAVVCREAFKKLTAYKGLAIPFMVEQLEDKRPSLDFHGHWKHRDVGAACYWNIRYQLEDTPGEYSSYGYTRKGRDGESHVEPYYQHPGQLPFNGLKKWWEENAGLSYTEKQIKCLRWLLEEEKKIGAHDADGYFENILPLEIRILQRRVQLGDDVQAELERLQKILKDKEVSAIPPELLPPQVKGPAKRIVE